MHRIPLPPRLVYHHLLRQLRAASIYSRAHAHHSFSLPKFMRDLEMHASFFINDKVRELINTNVIEHPIVRPASGRRELMHLKMYFWYKRVKSNFLVLATFIAPLEVGEQGRYHVA